MTVERIPIGTFSRVTRLSQRALRLYDERGLLVPADKDLCTGYRSYTYDQIGRGVTIGHLVALGFGLAEVGALLDARAVGDREIVRRLFTDRRTAVRAELGRLAAIEAALARGEADQEVFTMSITEPVIKEIPAMRVLSCRGSGTYGETITRLIGKICATLAPRNCREPAFSVAGPIMTLYHDTGCREQEAEIEVALPVAGRVEVDDPALELRTLSATRVVSALYTGPYPGISSAHEAVFKAVQALGLECDGPPREVYLNDPGTTPEQELMTEVQYPVA
ncbi:MAG: MerR family transcriptional regulator [Methanospirillum sp.]|nr:MerR family transcriptional regulator [Methanospirillum sp.]